MSKVKPAAVASTADPDIELIAPIYIVEAPAFCWKCDRSMTIISLAGSFEFGGVSCSEDELEFVFSSTITWLPSWVKHSLRSRYANFFADFSNTEKRTYYMNHCPSCRAKYGDFYLHSEPGDPLFPTAPEEASDLTLIEIHGLERLRVKSGLCAITPGLIKKYAGRKRAKYHNQLCPTANDASEI